jgi:3-phenylpropionate/trans-cinnamate dioxygenase ferredoxin reductase subunit
MSDPYEFLVVGGGPTGFSAARAYREAGGRGAVGIVSDEGRMPYHRPPLSKELLRGESSERDLPLEEELWLWREGISLIYGRAMLVDRARQDVVLAGGRRLDWRRLLLATGAEPVRPSIPGADDPSVRVLRSLDDLRELQARLEPESPVIVVGAGFIGCEVAASLRMLGHPVSLVTEEEAPNAGRLGEHAAGAIAEWLRQAGVRLSLGARVEQIERRDGELYVRAEALRLHAPLVVMATGVTPRGELLSFGGPSGAGGSVAVDSAMRTGMFGLMAAGDVAHAHNEAAGRALRVEHWGDALAQGAIAGRTAAGRAAAWDEVPGFWSTIGTHTLKYAAWGDGHDAIAVQRGDGRESFAVWYGKQERVAGVLTYECDALYERGRDLIAEGAAWTW